MYITRTQYSVSQGVILISINVVIYILILFDVLYIDGIYLTVLVIETTQKGIEVLIFLVLAARINDFFQIHIELLHENRDIILDMIALKDQFFNENSPFQVQSFIHRIGKAHVTRLSKYLQIENG